MKTKIWLFSILMVFTFNSLCFAADNVRIDALGALGATPAIDDIYVINDTSTSSTKSITTLNLIDAPNVDSYGGVEAAITAIGATNMTVVINSAQTLTANREFVSTLGVIVLPGGSIDQGNHTLTVSGPFVAAGFHVFTGTGTITCGTGSIDKFNVRWTGATGDGSTDDYAAINRAIAAYSDIYFPYGNYRIETTLTIAVDNKHLFADFGRPAQITNAISGNSSDAIVFTTSDPTDSAIYGAGCSIKNILVTSSAAVQTGGVALKVVKHSGFRVDNFTSLKHPYGIQLDGVLNSTLEHFYLWGASGETKVAGSSLLYITPHLNSDSSYAIPWTTSFSDFEIGGASQVDYLIHIQASDALHFSNSYIATAFTANVYIQAAIAGATVNTWACLFSNMYFDNADTCDYAVLMPDVNETIGSIKFDNCIFNGYDAAAVSILEDTMRGVNFTDCSFSFNDAGAIYMSSSTCKLIVNGCQFLDCREDADSGGVVASANSDMTTITNSQFYNLAGTAAYGVILSGTHNSAVVSNNIFENFTDGNIGYSATFTDGFRAKGNVSDASNSVASGATTTLHATSDFFTITGTAAITTIGGGWATRIVTMMFSGTAAGNGVTDAATIQLAGGANFAYTPNDTLILGNNGTNWYEISRSVN